MIQPCLFVMITVVLSDLCNVLQSVHALSLRGKHARAVLCPGLSYINYQESLPLRVWWEDLSRSGGGQAWYHRQAVRCVDRGHRCLTMTAL